MIRTSKHSTKFTNKNKLSKLELFIKEYQQALIYYVDLIWSAMVNYESPKFISTKSNKPNNTLLSQRALKCASTQACGMVRAQTERPRKVLWAIHKLQDDNKDTTTLNKWLNNYKPSKPAIRDNTKCELNSICCDLLIKDHYYFLQIKSLGKFYGKIRIPLKPHKQNIKWSKRGKMLNSFLICRQSVDIRYEIVEEYKDNGRVLGADQGYKTCLSLSDGQVTGNDHHNWNLEKIIVKLSKKKKGSNNFKKVQAHRKNYINWSINQLNLSDVKEIKLERVKDLRKGKVSSRLMSHWSYTLIKGKLIRFAQEQKVSVSEQSCVYRSQRCSKCGLVCKSNRKGKLYKCECGFLEDADVNASLNHEVELPNLDDIRCFRYNREGFYWLESGLYDRNNKEITVLYAKKS